MDPDGDGPQSAEATRFVYDGDQIVLQFKTAGSLTHRYLWNPAAVDQSRKKGVRSIYWVVCED